ncbi:MAG: ferredoxin [Candidatus Cloacimonetes bacterium]|nr:ferredoxin [Candidatus Cloacimonadota bacterium]
MKVKVDQLKCETIGICVKLCPEVFRFEIGSKKAVAKQGEIPTKFIDKCIEAKRKCPKNAIIVCN